MKTWVMGLTVFSAVSAWAAAQVDAVRVRQDRPWTKNVTVEYDITGASSPAAVSFEFWNGVNRLIPVSGAVMTGETKYAGNGTHSISFDPTQVFPSEADAFNAFRVRVVLGAENAAMGDKLYRIVDLDSGDITDLIRADFYNDRGLGAYETSFQAIGADYTTSLEDVFIWTGVTNNPIYKTLKLVLRRIPAKNVEWTMGSDSITSATPAHRVLLDHDYYMGVFAITQAQYYKLMGSYGGSQAASFQVDGAWGSHLYLPAAAISYDNLHGSGDAYETWPNSRTVNPKSFMGKLAELTKGQVTFDLPTEAQWEFAARAGTTTIFNSGLTDSGSKIGKASQGNTYPDAVGSRRPNAFGLYDTQGNVWEWCIDWYGDYTNDGSVQTNPPGVSKAEAKLDGSVAAHPIRGAAYSSTSGQFKIAFRTSYAPTKAYAILGGRVWASAE